MVSIKDLPLEVEVYLHIKTKKMTNKKPPNEFASGHEFSPSIGHWRCRSAFKVRIPNISAVFNLIDRRLGEKVEMGTTTYQTMLNFPGGSRWPPVKALKAPWLKSEWNGSVGIGKKRPLLGINVPRWLESHPAHVSLTVAIITLLVPGLS